MTRLVGRTGATAAIVLALATSAPGCSVVRWNQITPCTQKPIIVDLVIGGASLVPMTVGLVTENYGLAFASLGGFLVFMGSALAGVAKHPVPSGYRRVCVKR